MTYCVGVLLKDGLVMLSDTRTNAGVDNIATYRKLYIHEEPGERVIAMASSGNLSITQSVLSLINEGLVGPNSDQPETFANGPSMFQAAQLVAGRCARFTASTEEASKAIKCGSISPCCWGARSRAADCACT